MAIRWDEVEGTNFGPYLYSIEDEAERLEVLFRECYDEVRKQCAKALALAGNFSDADDATQETLMKAAASVRKTYKPEMPFRPWLRQIAQNVCRDFGRAQSRKDKTNERWVTSGYGVGVCTPAPEMESPEEALIRNLRNEAVVRSLLALPESERNALYWRVYKGLTYDEISELWGHSHSSVRTAIYRAKDKVKRHFVSLGGMDDWGLPGVVGAAVAAVRRFRARSRAWMMRNSSRGANVAAEGAPLNVALVARATEMVAAGVVALGALALPGGGMVASAPTAAPAMATTSAVHAPASAVDHAPSHAASSDPAHSSAPAMPTAGRATEVRVSSPDGSGPTQTATVERSDRSIVIGEGLTGPLPVVGEDYSRRGRTEFGCGGTSGQVVCGTYDRLPLGP